MSSLAQRKKTAAKAARLLERHAKELEAVALPEPLAADARSALTGALSEAAAILRDSAQRARNPLPMVSEV